MHWSIFAVASFYSNGVPVLEYLDRYGVPMAETAAHYHTFISFTGYITVFIAIVLSLRKGYYRYQMGACRPAGTHTARALLPHRRPAHLPSGGQAAGAPAPRATRPVTRARARRRPTDVDVPHPRHCGLPDPRHRVQHL